MKYIENFREGEQISDIYLCKQKQTLVSKAGKNYDSLLLQDKTGTVDGKIWDPNSAAIEDYDSMQYVFINAEVTIFNGKPQLKISRLRKVKSGEYDPADYVPSSPYNIGEMYDELTTLIGTVKNPYLSKLLKMFFVDNEEFINAFKIHSAAKSVHHGFAGGLLQHTLAVAKTCNFLAGAYPVLNRDLLVSAAIFHDAGKVRELSDFPLNDYTDEGQLIGHIVLGSEMVTEAAQKIEGFPPRLLTELKHCILSHHGEYEFGSPKKPAIIEAVALAYADNIDAKMETLTETFHGVTPGDTTWLGFNKWLDTNVRRTGIYED